MGGLKSGERSWGPYDCGLSDDIVGFRVIGSGIMDEG